MVAITELVKAEFCFNFKLLTIALGEALNLVNLAFPIIKLDDL